MLLKALFISHRARNVVSRGLIAVGYIFETRSEYGFAGAAEAKYLGFSPLKSLPPYLYAKSLWLGRR
jgi:hypothetical protein